MMKMGWGVALPALLLPLLLLAGGARAQSPKWVMTRGDLTTALPDSYKVITSGSEAFQIFVAVRDSASNALVEADGTAKLTAIFQYPNGTSVAKTSDVAISFGTGQVGISSVYADPLLRTVAGTLTLRVASAPVTGSLGGENIIVSASDQKIMTQTPGTGFFFFLWKRDLLELVLSLSLSLSLSLPPPPSPPPPPSFVLGPAARATVSFGATSAVVGSSIRLSITVGHACCAPLLVSIDNALLSPAGL